MNWFKRKPSPAERIEERMMREWIKEDVHAMNAELEGDEEAKALIRTHHLEVLFNSHATEPRWEVTHNGQHRCFSNEYSQPLGAAIRECVRKSSS